MTKAPTDTVFLIDVDNTLLDNDRIVADLRGHLEHEFGSLSASRYWVIFEALRSELDYTDYLGALQRYRLAAGFPRQGHYALDTANVAAYPPADISVDHIGDLVDMDIHLLLDQTAPIPEGKS